MITTASPDSDEAFALWLLSALLAMCEFNAPSQFGGDAILRSAAICAPLSSYCPGQSSSIAGAAGAGNGEGCGECGASIVRPPTGTEKSATGPVKTGSSGPSTWAEEDCFLGREFKCRFLNTL